LAQNAILGLFGLKVKYRQYNQTFKGLMCLNLFVLYVSAINKNKIPDLANISLFLDISKINIFNKTQKVPNIYFERNEY
jgi:hypothetical protein